MCGFPYIKRILLFRVCIRALYLWKLPCNSDFTNLFPRSLPWVSSPLGRQYWYLQELCTCQRPRHLCVEHAHIHGKLVDMSGRTCLSVQKWSRLRILGPPSGSWPNLRSKNGEHIDRDPHFDLKRNVGTGIIATFKTIPMFGNLNI